MTSTAHSTSDPNTHRAIIDELLHEMHLDHQDFKRNQSDEDFSEIADVQKPRATVLMCSDSRLHTHVFYDTPVNELFIIRNIGNQIQNAEGSIEFGISNLETPMLLIVGHAGCGAIAASRTDYTGESPAIRHELNSLSVDHEPSNRDAVLKNVHDQVAFAVKKFKDRINNHMLTVVGAVYDFRNDYHRGTGAFFIINVNNETDQAKLKEAGYLR